MAVSRESRKFDVGNKKGGTRELERKGKEGVTENVSRSGLLGKGQTGLKGKGKRRLKQDLGSTDEQHKRGESGFLGGEGGRFVGGKARGGVPVFWANGGWWRKRNHQRCGRMGGEAGREAGGPQSMVGGDGPSRREKWEEGRNQISGGSARIARKRRQRGEGGEKYSK